MRQWYVLSQRYGDEKTLENYLNSCKISFKADTDFEQHRIFGPQIDLKPLYLRYKVLMEKSDLTATVLSVPGIYVMELNAGLKFKNSIRKFFNQKVK